MIEEIISTGDEVLDQFTQGFLIPKEIKYTAHKNPSRVMIKSENEYFPEGFYLVKTLDDKNFVAIEEFDDYNLKTQGWYEKTVSAKGVFFVSEKCTIYLNLCRDFRRLWDIASKNIPSTLNKTEKMSSWKKAKVSGEDYSKYMTKLKHK